MSNEPKKRILVVDDEEMIRYLHCEMCDAIGFEAVEAENGQEALQILQEQSFDAMIIDLMMPIMDGISVLKQIHDTPFMPKRVCIVSAGTRRFEDESEQFLKSISVPHFRKPFPLDKLEDFLLKEDPAA